MSVMKKIDVREEKEWKLLTTKQKTKTYDICVVTYHKDNKDQYIYFKPKECIEMEKFLHDERKQFELISSYDRDIILENIWVYLPNKKDYYHISHPLINWSDMYKLVNDDENTHIYNVISIKLSSSFYRYDKVFL